MQQKIKNCIILSIIAFIIISGCISSENSESDETSLKDAKADYELLVSNACALIEAEGPESFDAIRNESEWNKGDMYVYVWQTDGIRVVYPPDPTKENMDVSGLEDANGKPIGELFIKAATSAPSEGWVMYEWPKPEGTEPELKYSFHKKATFDGTDYVVGSGFYLSDYIIVEKYDSFADPEVINGIENMSLVESYHPKNYDISYEADFSFATLTLAKGESVARHAMTNAELWVVVEGQGTLHIEELPIPVSAGSVVMIPPGATQYATAEENSALVAFMINQPQWNQENYEDR